MPAAPVVSVVVPTHNNVDVLRRCLDAWQQHGSDAVEIVVVEDGCTDGTRELLESIAATAWGQRQLRWIHQDDAHELRCTNAGFAAARGPLLVAWQDDMFLRAGWLVPELIRTFRDYPEIGLVSLSRGLNCFPLDQPVDTYENLVDWRRLQSTIGPSPANWFRLQEVDGVIRPWVVRRACIDRVGALDEAFVPTEWDESDLAFRIRQAGWSVATSGYERLGAYVHLGSTTLSRGMSPAYIERVLRNGRLFLSRWSDAIVAEHSRRRRVWRRRAGIAGWIGTARAMVTTARRRLTSSA